MEESDTDTIPRKEKSASTLRYLRYDYDKKPKLIKVVSEVKERFDPKNIAEKELKDRFTEKDNKYYLDKNHVNFTDVMRATNLSRACQALPQIDYNPAWVWSPDPLDCAREALGDRLIHQHGRAFLIDHRPAGINQVMWETNRIRRENAVPQIRYLSIWGV